MSFVSFSFPSSDVAYSMVNNAGIAPEASTGFQPTWKVSLDTWNSVMATNCNGTFYGVQAAASQMLEQESHPDFGGDRGWIINMSSVAGLKAFRGHGESVVVVLEIQPDWLTVE